MHYPQEGLVSEVEERVAAVELQLGELSSAATQVRQHNPADDPPPTGIRKQPPHLVPRKRAVAAFHTQ